MSSTLEKGARGGNLVSAALSTAQAVQAAAAV